MMNLDDFDFDSCYNFVITKYYNTETPIHSTRAGVSRFLSETVENYEFVNYLEENDKIAHIIYKMIGTQHI